MTNLFREARGLWLESVGPVIPEHVMSHLRSYGTLSLGHQFIEDKAIPVLQRTVVVTDHDTGKILQQAETDAITLINDLASDRYFRDVFLSGRAPHIVDEGISMIVKHAILDLRKLYKTLLKHQDELCDFLRTLGHTVDQSPNVAFIERGKTNIPVVMLVKEDDIEKLRWTIFTEAQIRLWISDDIARRGN